MLVARAGLVPLAKDLAPFALVKVGEPDIGFGRGVHLSEIDAVRLRKNLAEHILAADYHDLAGAGSRRRVPRGCEPLIQAVGHYGIGRDEALVAGEHDVEPAVENARQRLEGAPSHDHRLAHSDFSKIAHV